MLVVYFWLNQLVDLLLCLNQIHNFLVINGGEQICNFIDGVNNASRMRFLYFAMLPCSIKVAASFKFKHDISGVAKQILATNVYAIHGVSQAQNHNDKYQWRVSNTSPVSNITAVRPVAC
jgi:tRNA U34 5-carboxymethylaminomethyl modifying enzyme MnmG/GidA